MQISILEQDEIIPIIFSGYIIGGDVTGPFEITAGTGGQNWGDVNFPKGDPCQRFYYDGRAQFVILASELSTAGVTSGDITALALRCREVPGVDSLNFHIRIQHTAATTSTNEVTSNWTIVYGPITVTTAEFTAGNWTQFIFDSAFNWNGSDNLLIDFTVDNVNTFSNSGGLYCRTDLTNRMFSNWGDNTNSWPFDENQNTQQYSQIPEIRFYK